MATTLEPGGNPACCCSWAAHFALGASQFPSGVELRTPLCLDTHDTGANMYVPASLDTSCQEAKASVGYSKLPPRLGIATRQLENQSVFGKHSAVQPHCTVKTRPKTPPAYCLMIHMARLFRNEVNDEEKEKRTKENMETVSSPPNLRRPLAGRVRDSIAERL